MKQIDYCCPNITCHAFGKPWPLEVWERGDTDPYTKELIHPIDFGDPIHDDELECGNCPSHTVPVTEFTEALEDLLKPSQSHS